MSQAFNYRHLYYFWIVANEGSMVGAAKRLNMAIQTISTQVKLLEQELGFALFKPKGRGLTLTDAGVAALLEADHIFAIGEKLPGKIRDAVHGQQYACMLAFLTASPNWLYTDFLHRF